MGLVVASSAAQAFEFIGLPEGIYPIVEATLYLATAPKSNTAGAYFKAMKKIEEEGQVSVPRHLMDGNRDAAAWDTAKITSTRTTAKVISHHNNIYPNVCWEPISIRPHKKATNRKSPHGWRCGAKPNARHWALQKLRHIPDMSEEQIIEMKRKIR
jgi:hypothetical protein